MGYKKELDRVRFLLENDKAQDARSLFQELSEENTVEYHMLKGKLEQKFQKWGEAINAYNKVLELDGQNTEAKNNLHVIQNILNFWNPDMFNP